MMTVYQKIAEFEDMIGQELSDREANELLSQWGIDPENVDWEEDVF